jgi:pimeloyl-ACP methyl ester carboxylesterase
MPSRTTNLITGAAAVAGTAAWLGRRSADLRRIEADPEWAFLSDPPAGRPLSIPSFDGTVLHAEVFGPDDAPTVVLAHGWTCALRFWCYQTRDLADEFRVVAYDQRGHGRSERARNRDYSIDAYGDDLAAVLEAVVPAGERAVVAGHSLGGMTIASFAGRHEQQLQRLVAGVALINTGMGDLVTETLVVRMPEGLGELRQVIGQRVLSAKVPFPKGPTPVTHRAIRYIALCPAATPAQVAFTERLVLESHRDARASTGGSVSRIELHHALEALTVPTLVIAGERDKLTPPSHARRMAEVLPGPVELVEVPDTGHMTPIEAPDIVTARVRALARDALADARRAA